MQTADKPIQGKDFLAESLEGEIILIHPVSKNLIHLNSSGALIWHLCNGQRDIGEIIRLLSDSYSESASQIQSDVPAILESLSAQGAIGWV
jgi:hypothetical protein